VVGALGWYYESVRTTSAAGEMRCTGDRSPRVRLPRARQRLLVVFQL
jgi:hypothetical protein